MTTPPERREVKTMSIIIQDWNGKRKYEKMLAAGWTVDHIVPRALSRASTYVFSRPKKGKR
ncbi:hypothetical protein [Mycetocola tolaasinivorans]|uniref:hypothetical protein n=1 Tax=Mycetocola tolaasinivorans TaxID=76635 RepID=UPI000EF4A556|nr:hypothetical protein [Mycetocola tolaasinivorans]